MTDQAEVVIEAPEKAATLCDGYGWIDVGDPMRNERCPGCAGCRDKESTRPVSRSRGRSKKIGAKAVFDFIASSGDQGATDDEIERATGLIHATASARRNDLVRSGQVKRSSLTRKTRRGRAAIVWVATAHATGAITKRPSRPSKTALRAAATEIRALIAPEFLGEPRQVSGSENLCKVIDWIERLAAST
jgi:hypothetical protein